MKRCIYILMSLSLAAVTGCSEPDVPKRHYQEIIVEAAPHMEHDDAQEAHASMRDVPMPLHTRQADEVTLSWDTPDGWSEGAGSGMRLATWRINDAPDGTECTLIVLSGDAGGLAANIVRWMEQVQIAPPSDAALRAYVDGLERIQTQRAMTGVLVDFDEFVDDPSALSTLAAIIESGRETLFVKLTGPKGVLARERENFIQLCISMR